GQAASGLSPPAQWWPRAQFRISAIVPSDATRGRFGPLPASYFFVRLGSTQTACKPLALLSARTRSWRTSTPLTSTEHSCGSLALATGWDFQSSLSSPHTSKTAAPPKELPPPSLRATWALRCFASLARRNFTDANPGSPGGCMLMPYAEAAPSTTIGFWSF